MRALVLAAGRGSRMEGRTADRPKGLLEVGGRALVEWQLAAFAGAGVDEVAVVTGYRGDALRSRLGARATWFENARWSETNMVASLAAAAEWLAAEDCVVSYADLVYPAKAVHRLLEAPGDVTLLYDTGWRALWERRFADPREDAESFALRNGRLAAIGGPAEDLDTVEGQYMGLFRLTPDGAAQLLDRWRAAPDGERERMDVTGLLALLLEGGAEIDAVAYDGWWCEIDQESDLRVAEEVVR